MFSQLVPEAAQAVVFDCDGTLLDSMPYHFEVWVKTCNVFGVHLDQKLMADTAGKPVHELYDYLCSLSGVVADHDAYFNLLSENYKTATNKVALIEPVMNLVREAKARGLPVGVASGGTREHVMRSLTATGIIDLFDAIVVGEDVKRGKPQPDAFLLAAEKLGVAPEFCVGFEDAPLGIQAIEAAGYMSAIDVTKFDGYPHFP